MTRPIELHLAFQTSTTSPEDFANLIAEHLSFTGVIRTKAEVKDCKYTGNRNGKLLHGKEKAID
jgi:phosphoserine phosphatase